MIDSSYDWQDNVLGPGTSLQPFLLNCKCNLQRHALSNIRKDNKNQFLSTFVKMKAEVREESTY